MITFDKMKITSSINNITDFNTDIFHANIKGGEVLYYKYRQDKPYYLMIMIDYEHGELVIEFTGKILLDQYPSLINKDNIRECFLQINRMAICRLDVEAILRDAQVVKCDVTKDIAHDNIEEIASYIRQNLSNYKRWSTTPYNRQGITLENVAKTPKYKKRMVIYDKEKELRTTKNSHFLSILDDKEKLLSYFRGKVRFELNINTMSMIRNLLNIANNSLHFVLNSTTNPILSVIDEAVRYTEIKHIPQTLREYEHGLLLKECNYDMVEVEAKVRALSSKNTSISRTMQPYKELHQRYAASSSNKINLRELVA